MADTAVIDCLLLNVLHENYASFKNSNEAEPAKSVTPRLNNLGDNTCAHKWRITCHSGGLYTIYNIVHDVYARSSADFSHVSASQNPNEHEAEQWCIMRLDDTNRYQIIKQDGARRVWKIDAKGQGHEVVLADQNNGSDSHWRIFDYDGRDIDLPGGRSSENYASSPVSGLSPSSALTESPALPFSISHSAEEVLPPGLYTLQNAQFNTFAAFTMKRENQPAVSIASNGHQWYLSRCPDHDGTYILTSSVNMLCAGISKDSANVCSATATRPDIYWRVTLDHKTETYQIKSANTNQCWSLQNSRDGAIINLVDDTNASAALWTFKSDTPSNYIYYPDANKDSNTSEDSDANDSSSKRSSEGSKVERKAGHKERAVSNAPKQSAVKVHLPHPKPAAYKAIGIFDFQASRSPTKAIDIVVILHLQDDEAYDDVIKEVKDVIQFPTEFHASVRFGQVISSSTDPAWRITKIPLSQKLGKKSTSTTVISRSREFICGALEEALDMNWREDAAKLVIMYSAHPPCSERRSPTDDDSFSEKDIIRQLREKNILFVLRARNANRELYYDTSKVIGYLRSCSPLVSLSPRCMMCWICRSTYNETDIKHLLEEDFPDEASLVPQENTSSMTPRSLARHMDETSLPPRGWTFTEAMNFWDLPPRGLRKIVALAKDDIKCRAKLLHTLPYLKIWDMRAYTELKDADVMKNFCGHFFLKSSTMYSCSTCAVGKNRYANFCRNCWNSTSHRGHRTRERSASDDDHVCECGDLLDNDEVTGYDCDIHA